MIGIKNYDKEWVNTWFIHVTSKEYFICVDLPNMLGPIVPNSIHSSWVINVFPMFFLVYLEINIRDNICPDIYQES